VVQTRLLQLVSLFDVASEEEGRIPKIRLKVNTDGPVEVEIVKSEKKMSIMSMLNDDHGGLDALVSAALSEKPENTSSKSLLPPTIPKGAQSKQTVAIATTVGPPTIPGSLTSEISKLTPVPVVSATNAQVKVIHLAPSQSSNHPQPLEKKAPDLAVELKTEPIDAITTESGHEVMAQDHQNVETNESKQEEGNTMEENLPVDAGNETIVHPETTSADVGQLESVGMEVSESMNVDNHVDKQEFAAPPSMDVDNSMVASSVMESVPDSEMQVDHDMQLEEEQSEMALDDENQ
jgi:hypothetical protein